MLGSSPMQTDSAAAVPELSSCIAFDQPASMASGMPAMHRRPQRMGSYASSGQCNEAHMV